MKKGLKRLLSLALMTVVVAVAASVLIGCGEGAGAKTITNLVYNGENITWTRVLKAEHYMISIDGGQAVKVDQTESATISYAFKSENNFNVALEAVIKEGSDKNPTLSQDFKNLGKVVGIGVDSGKLVWDSIEGVDGYEIMQNGEILTQPVGVNEYALSSGTFTFKVRAIKGRTEAVDGNNGNYALWSDTFTCTVLDSPKNLKYDSEFFTWDKVTKAESYTIKIGGEEFTTTDLKYEFAAGKNDFMVSVKANGDEEEGYYSSAFCEEKSYTYLERITTMNVVEGVLVWDKVDKANAYKIRIDGVLQNDSLTTNKYDKLQSGRSYQISLLPIGSSDFYFSQWSNVITINVLSAPTVSFEGNAVKWTGISNAGGYKLEIMKEGEVVAAPVTNKDTVVYSGYSFDEPAKYTVKVLATTEPESGYYESKYSSAFPVRRLGAPDSVTVTNRPEENRQVSISFSPVVGAKSYTLKVNETEYGTKSNGTAFDIDITSMTSLINASSIIFEVLADGQTTTAEAILGSVSGGEVTVNKLATPQNFSISGAQLSWAGVTGVESYIVSIDGKRYSTATQSFTLPALSAGEHTAYVQAAGNRANVISSSYSDAVTLTKLAAPTNLVIDASGILSWTSPTSGATNFVVMFGANSFDRNVNNFDIKGYTDNMSAGVLTQLTVRAKGNGAEILDSDQSKTGGIYKYTAPTGLGKNGSNLSWNQPEYNGTKCNSYKLVITKAGGEPQEITASGNSYSLSSLEAGSYTATVTALGNKTQTWDSAPSTSFTFTKLDDITGITRSGNKITWNAVTGATAYQVKVSDKIVASALTAPEFTVNFDKAGEYTILITAIGNTTNVFDSNTYSMSQKVQAINQPVKDTDFTVVRNGNNITITINTVYSNATEYEYVIGGISNKSVDTSYTFNGDNAAAVNVQVKIKGGKFGGDVYYIDSNLSTIANV